MLPTHELVATRDGYEIWRRKPGFEFTPVTLGKIASFMAQGPGGEIAVFAFMYSLLASLDTAPNEHDLLMDALRVIEERITAGRIGDRQDATFEYHDGHFVEVGSPRWWIPTTG